MVITTEILDTPQAIVKLVGKLTTIRESPDRTLDFSPFLYIDLEGVALCREGTISILTLLVYEHSFSQQTYLIDVHTQGAQVFTAAGRNDKTLKHILEDPDIAKVFFDVRNDSDALFAHYGVALEGVQDVQLMESATRESTRSRKYLSGLAKCIENNATDQFGQRRVDWSKAKAAGEKLFTPEHGGS
jgi:exonuclease 3'-5' domain-containing protein 1